MTKDVEAFWQDYAERLKEKVLFFVLGQYLSGMDDFPDPLWGLVIVTDAGLRFHHFPQDNWLVALSRLGGGGSRETPREKTFFIPLQNLVNSNLVTEKSFFKRLIHSSLPRLELEYQNETGQSRFLVCEINQDGDKLIQALTDLCK